MRERCVRVLNGARVAMLSCLREIERLLELLNLLEEAGPVTLPVHRISPRMTSCCSPSSPLVRPVGGKHRRPLHPPFFHFTSPHPHPTPPDRPIHQSHHLESGVQMSSWLPTLPQLLHVVWNTVTHATKTTVMMAAPMADRRKSAGREEEKEGKHEE